MHDRELDLNMATEVCGIPVLRYEELIEQYPHITVVGKHVFLWKRAKENGVDWNPCGNWNQVFDHVVPALKRRECAIVTELEAGRDTLCIWYTETGKIQSGAESLTPRAFCEAALEAFEQLKSEKS